MTTPAGPSPTTNVGTAPPSPPAHHPAPTPGGPPKRTRPVDPRLLRYAGAARTFFAIAAVIGAAQTLVTIAFAWLLTLAVVRVIEGAPAEELIRITTMLLGAVLARAALIWAAEWASAQAAARVSAQLRAALVDAVRTLGPGWLARQNTASLAVTAGHGLDALDAYFGRYLPQLVLTVIATPTILVVMAWQDWLSGLTVALTLPLIPIFMVLIGLATRSVQRTQWQTLHRLAARFSDTVEGLGTLKLYGRERRAVANIERVTGEYRRETMRVLRVSFLSGFALEFLASIAVALIAVSIGFRLLDGTLTLMVGLFVLLLAPEAYLPMRQVGVQFHAAAEGVAATDDIFAVLDAATAARARCASGAGQRSARSAAQGSARHAANGADAVDHPAVYHPAGTLVVRGLRARVGDLVVPAPAHPAIAFTATPGTITLIEGPSGSGKSSLLAALRGTAEFEGTAILTGDAAGAGTADASRGAGAFGGAGASGGSSASSGSGTSGGPVASGGSSASGGPVASSGSSTSGGLGASGSSGTSGASDASGASGAFGERRDVRALRPAEWLAWAGQRPGLIAGTVAANVALGDPAPDASGIARALELAQAGHLDPALELGVQGAGLSGGQAQRVAVARAMYRLQRGASRGNGAARVLALDEPSSALDAATEAALWRAIRGLADEGATVLLVSHRRSAREIADQVVRLGAGTSTGTSDTTGRSTSTTADISSTTTTDPGADAGNAAQEGAGA